MKKNNYSYIGISFIILVFGIIFIPKIINRITNSEIVDGDRHNLVRKGNDNSIFADSLMVIGSVPKYTFTSHRNVQVTNDTYKNKVYVAEFFFSTCPDICPIMNRNMVKIQTKFKGNTNVGVASFSIDPSYDTPEILSEYAENYNITNPHWNLLTGDKKDIMKLANEGFKIYAAESEGGGFEHSGMFALIDQDGNIRSRFDENNNPIIYYDGLEDEGIRMIMEDIQLLLEE